MNELIREVLHEIAAEPLRFAVEIMQFLLLTLIIRLILQRVVGPNLKERRERIAAEVEKADRADAAYAEAQQQTVALVAEARAKAQQVIEAAKAAAQEERTIGLARVDEEADAILLQAKQTIETETGKVTSEASEQLVMLITQVTRRFLEEAMTENERQEVTQKLILSSLNKTEGSASP
jgi:F0F1-type ATP synthase membrane subunit b/b'